MTVPPEPLLTQIITDMQHASDAADEANGESDYTVRLIALALIARHFLRERAALAGEEDAPAVNPFGYESRTEVSCGLCSAEHAPGVVVFEGDPRRRLTGEEFCCACWTRLAETVRGTSE